MPLLWQWPAHVNTVFILVAMLTCVPLLTSPPVMAGEVTLVNGLDFGAIDLNPAGDTIVIAAQNGSASPKGSRSVVTGGGSGLIQVTSVEAEHVEILYPDLVPLVCGSHSLQLTNIGLNSQYHLTGVDLPGGGAIRTISVGGSLELRGNETYGNCSGSMALQVNFF